MTASILSIGTAVPPARVSQTAARDVFAAQPGSQRISQRLIHAAFDASAIEHRNTVLADLVAVGERRDAEDGSGMPAAGAGGTILSPSTGARNDAYIRLAPPLFAEASAQALAEASVAPDEVSHVVTVSCTGMFAPGPGLPARGGPRALPGTSSGTTSASWAARRRCPGCARPRASARLSRRRSCWSPPPSCARCTSGRRRIRSRSSRHPSSPTAPRRPSSRRGPSATDPASS